ncbi:MAG: 50S ribosomal protein L35 [bacterium]
MPKMKTRKAVAKRFKTTKNGKIKHKHANKGHLLTKKDRDRKQKLRQYKTLDSADKKRIKAMLPYGS